MTSQGSEEHTADRANPSATWWTAADDDEEGVDDAFKADKRVDDSGNIKVASVEADVSCSRVDPESMETHLQGDPGRRRP